MRIFKLTLKILKKESVSKKSDTLFPNIVKIIIFLLEFLALQVLPEGFHQSLVLQHSDQFVLHVEPVLCLFQIRLD